MAIARSVWGIDIGQCALKALKLNEVDGVMQVEGLDVVEHEHTLSEPDIDRNQLIRTALETFLSRNEVSGSILAVAVGISLLLVLVGMTQGTLREVARRMQATGADLLVHPQDMNPVLDTLATLPVQAVGRVRVVAWVQARPAAKARWYMSSPVSRSRGMSTFRGDAG